MLIRQTNLIDIRSVYDLICDLEATKLDYKQFERVFNSQLADEKFVCIVAEDNGRIIGCLNLRIEEQLHHVGKIAEIMELVVTDSSRSQGIGKKLWTKAMEISRSNDCLQLEVASNQQRRWAHKFYENQGMSKTHYKLTLQL